MNNKLNQQLANELILFKNTLAKISLPKKEQAVFLEYLEAIEEEFVIEAKEFRKHKNPNTFWLSLAPIQHYFGNCQEALESATGEQRDLDLLNQQLDTWLQRIEEAIPNFQPENKRLFTILELAADGKYYNDDTHDYSLVMPEDWPYKHFFEG